jgi:hypothetical protein
MVRVSAIRDLENCLESAPVKEFELDGKICEDLMRRMAVDARLQYFPHFPRPYFRIDRNNAWAIQGIIGNTTLRVTLTPAAAENAEERLRCLIER